MKISSTKNTIWGQKYRRLSRFPAQGIFCCTSCDSPRNCRFGTKKWTLDTGKHITFPSAECMDNAK